MKISVVSEKQCPQCKQTFSKTKVESNSVFRARIYCNRNCYSLANSGRGNYLFGKHLSEETKKKLSLSKTGKPSKIKGIPKSWEAIKKMRIAHRDNQMGSNNPNWKGGTTKLRTLIAANYRYTEWKLEVFERDNYYCQVKGCKSTDLHPHHLKSIGQSINDHNLKTIEEAIKCQEIWDVNNGITLCKKHHRETHSYGRPFTRGGKILR